MQLTGTLKRRLTPGARRRRLAKIARRRAAGHVRPSTPSQALPRQRRRRVSFADLKRQIFAPRRRKSPEVTFEEFAKIVGSRR